MLLPIVVILSSPVTPAIYIGMDSITNVCQLQEFSKAINILFYFSIYANDSHLAMSTWVYTNLLSSSEL